MIQDILILIAQNVLWSEIILHAILTENHDEFSNRIAKIGAGNQLFQRYLRSIYRFFRNKLQGDVDELVQATFLACVRGRDQFNQRGSFRGYLFAIARHELYGHLRRRRRGGRG